MYSMSIPTAESQLANAAGMRSRRRQPAVRRCCLSSRGSGSDPSGAQREKSAARQFLRLFCRGSKRFNRVSHFTPLPGGLDAALPAARLSDSRLSMRRHSPCHTALGARKGRVVRIVVLKYTILFQIVYCRQFIDRYPPDPFGDRDDLEQRGEGGPPPPGRRPFRFIAHNLRPFCCG